MGAGVSERERMRPFSVCLPEGLKHQVDAAAERAGVSRSDWLRTAAEERLQRVTLCAAVRKVLTELLHR